MLQSVSVFPRGAIFLWYIPVLAHRNRNRILLCRPVPVGLFHGYILRPCRYDVVPVDGAHRLICRNRGSVPGREGCIHTTFYPRHFLRGRLVSTRSNRKKHTLPIKSSTTVSTVPSWAYSPARSCIPNTYIST